MPKPSRGSGGSHTRSHSRSSSTSKLPTTNLQFTQKDPPPPKHTDKSKKSTFPHEAHVSTKVPPPFVRLNSSQRVHSKEQLGQPPLKRPLPPQKLANGKSKPGFTFASPSENADGDDDDDWVSSESGVATPNHQDSTSDSSSETDEDHHPAVTHLTMHSDITDQHGLTRVDTVRPFDFKPQTPRRTYAASKPVTPPPQPPMSPRSPAQPEFVKEVITAPVSRHSPRPSSRRYSRPPSTHSISSRSDHPLRPHPLIRGQSYGHLNSILPKPTPLAPLTVIPYTEISSRSSPPNPSSHENGSSSSSRQHQQYYLSSSPTSMKTSSGSPILPDLTSSTRRTSFSSTGSINTIPVHSSLTAQIPYPVPSRTHDRTRTLSTLSSSSSSAALSSLNHLPYVLSHTRPSSPTPHTHTISFFPPVNPQHTHAMEGIHPLLPAPYLSNHLTVLARRTPIRESFDRVVRARSGR